MDLGPALHRRLLRAAERVEPRGGGGEGQHHQGQALHRLQQVPRLKEPAQWNTRVLLLKISDLNKRLNLVLDHTLNMTLLSQVVIW